ncbi:hypothetical protein Bca4012_025413 [Brassica carinata]
MLCCCLRFGFRVIECCNVLYRKVMKGNQKVAKKKGVPNERRRLSLRPRPSPIAKTPVVAEGSKKSKKSKKSTQEREPSYVSLSVTDESERDGSESERSKKSTPVREPSHQPRSMSDESEREGSDSEVYILYHCFC